jgi:hypothetical protein
VKALTPRQIVASIAQCSHDQQRTLAAMEHYQARDEHTQVELLRDWYKGEHRRKLLNLAYCAKLEARITELQEQLDAAQIAEAFEATVERELERG